MKKSSSETSLSKGIQNVVSERGTNSSNPNPQHYQNDTFPQSHDTKTSPGINKEPHELEASNNPDISYTYTTNDRVVLEFPSPTGNGTLDPTSNTNDTATNTTNIPNGNAEQATREGNIPTQLPPPYAPPHTVLTVNNPAVDAADPNTVISTPYQPVTMKIAKAESGMPMNTVCPYCNTQVTSVVNTERGTMSILCCVITCLICWPLFWLPLVMNSCLDKVHTCPNCRRVIAKETA
ncbi:hypothetical protein BB558_006324 [Smittium angustum]|uniref:LITAF domain-containing protein n=1 Tax=Smittium angustum TaxID=133377 RepID=A0A2U1IY19_SMIAN|nr:hypothetical protein BB558_006324 [Smittium angustum]